MPLLSHFNKVVYNNMGQHILQLNFPESSNEGIFLIDDISIYDGMASGISGTTVPFLPVNCANIQITPPGCITPTSLSVIQGFRLVLNACLLGMLPVNNCVSNCPCINDGMYNVRYSISPNDKVYVEYKVLRIVEAMNRYHKTLCGIGLQPCLPDKEIQYQVQQLDLIYNMLISAKHTVEDLHQFSNGMNLYKFAVELLSKFNNKPTRC